MIGISRKTGQRISGWDLFIDLAEDALTTQLGSREKRRDYGSRLPELLSKLTSDNLLLLAQVYATETIEHPPNNLSHLFVVDRVIAYRTDNGFRLQLIGKYNGQSAQFEVPFNANGSQPTA